MSNRTIFIGDIHGCFDEFKALIKKLKIKSNDRVFLTGDLIFKGPKSLKVLKYVYKNRDNFYSIQGNKEFELLNAIKSRKYYSTEEKKLGEKLLKSHPKILKFIKKMPYYVEEKDFILIHGGIVPRKSIQDHTPYELCYLREYDNKAWYEYYTGARKIFYGHWSVKGVNIKNNTVGLDSGCVYGGKLTAYILETGEIIQQSAFKLYKNPFKKPNIRYHILRLGFSLKNVFKKGK